MEYRKMKIQEIFNKQIEQLNHIFFYKYIFITQTLYDGYIKKPLINKDLSILLLTDYQEFTNNLLSKIRLSHT